MYTRVTFGGYESKADADEAMSLLKESLLPKHRAVAGAKDMYALRTGETSSMVVAIYDSQESAERANSLRGESIERMRRYQTDHPRIIDGASHL
ncbi:hypothetical protein JQX13_29020 [Archangium violaceum]|uniref:hypothetical protein n=1 Tax=Archangium violaceum TaxID=83451 RepID=UPI00193C303E|nr:hypothetical protein [Archangium violaceum]QRK04306.1 hypothetical protein JQX13_29020 [Archangium violaceum]